MKPNFDHRAVAREQMALVEPGTPLPDLLAELAARMTPEQRGAFLAKMTTMDRQRELTPAAVTRGRA